MISRATLGFVAMVLCGVSVLGAAAQPAAGPVSGTVISIATNSFELRTTEHQQARVTWSASTRVVMSVAGSLAQLRPGDFIGTTAEERDGKLVATEVHIFSEGLRGTGEGHYPWTQPNTTMTNGAVATMTNGTASLSNQRAMTRDEQGITTLIVKYKEGQQTVQVSSATPISRIELVEISKLKVGEHVTVFGNLESDGSLAANMLSIEGEKKK